VLDQLGQVGHVLVDVALAARALALAVPAAVVGHHPERPGQQGVTSSQWWAADEHRRGIALVRDYLQTGGPFPERLHLITLMVRFLGFEWGAAVHRWATWAEQEVLAWPDVRAVEPNRQALEDYLRLADDQLAEADRTGRAELSDAQSRSSS
jgi:hypothetical protein